MPTNGFGDLVTRNRPQLLLGKSLSRERLQPLTVLFCGLCEAGWGGREEEESRESERACPWELGSAKSVCLGRGFPPLFPNAQLNKSGKGRTSRCQGALGLFCRSLSSFLCGPLEGLRLACPVSGNPPKTDLRISKDVANLV